MTASPSFYVRVEIGPYGKQPIASGLLSFNVDDIRDDWVVVEEKCQRAFHQAIHGLAIKAIREHESVPDLPAGVRRP